MTVDPQRHTALWGAKLRALVRDHLGLADEALGVLEPFHGGAALVRDGETWILVDERPARALGPALAWARRYGPGRVNVVADVEADVLARRARYFSPAPAVWAVDGRALRAADPAPLTPPGPLDARLAHLAEVIEDGGATPVVEHGVLLGEVAGLEVCRAVFDPHVEVARLEVGVGVHDREAFQLVHGDVPPAGALSEVVRRVAEHRRPGAEPHPLNRIDRERLLRDRLIADPSAVGALALSAAPPPVPRPNLKEPFPAVASGVDDQGRPLVVVCSVGIDLDLVPFAADARAAVGPPGARLVLAVPDRDDHPVTRALVEMLVEPAELVAVAPVP